MRTQTFQTIASKQHVLETSILTVAVRVVKSLTLMATLMKPSLDDEYAPAHYSLYGQYIPVPVNPDQVLLNSNRNRQY